MKGDSEVVKPGAKTPLIINSRLFSKYHHRKVVWLCNPTAVTDDV
jgi:hypothetical protein